MLMHVLDNRINENGEVELFEYDVERDYSATEGRHCKMCVVCGFSSYPKCREWCTKHGYEAEKKKPNC